jgi:hypothetical protein
MISISSRVICGEDDFTLQVLRKVGLLAGRREIGPSGRNESIFYWI